MALNYIWIALFFIGFIVGVIKLIMGDFETLPAMMDSTFEMSKNAFEMCLGLTGTLALWMGILKIGEDSGLIRRLASFLSPVLTRLFPDIPKGHPALGSIFMNISANMLGLDNAATPIGLKAMKELQSINKEKDTASNSMIMFLTLNTSGITIIPISIMAYRAQSGAADPTDVFIPLLLTSLCSTVFGLIVCSIYQRINLFNRYILLMFGVIAAFVGALFFAIHGMNQEEMQHFCRVLTSVMILGAIMYMGACAGSTSGGFKCIRSVMILKVVRNNFRQILHPNAVLPVKINGQNIPQAKLISLLAFFSLTIMMVLVTVTIMIVAGIDNTNAVVIALSSVSNVGPNLANQVGPSITWAMFPDYIKWALCLLMLMGRLEIMTVLVLFTRSFWKEN